MDDAAGPWGAGGRPLPRDLSSTLTLTLKQKEKDLRLSSGGVKYRIFERKNTCHLFLERIINLLFVNVTGQLISRTIT